MTAFRTALILAAVCIISTTAALAEEPAIKKKGDKEKEFWKSVGEAIVKKARSDPRKMEMEDMKITEKKGATHRRIVELKMIYFGSVSGSKFTADIKIDCDATDKDKWEVLSIEYKDDNRTPRLGSDARIKEYIKVLNR